MLRKENGRIILKVLIFIILFIVIVGACGLIWYNLSIKPVQTQSEKVIVEIEYGTGISKIADQLEASGVIKNAEAFKIYCKMNNRTLIKAGKYEFDKNMTIDQILSMVEKENVLDETVTITFPEGKNIKWIVATIAENTNNTEEQIYALLEDETYINGLIEKYWFITKDVKDDEIYFSLEGYLYPDTYIFANKDESVDKIFAKMLDKMDAIITPYREKIENSDYSVHEVLALASMVELEAKNKDDRAGVAAVFSNRLDAGMALQSDVTTYYGLQLAMDKRELTTAELNEDNGYNTRASSMAGKIPVGPICMVSDSSINAVLNPKDTKDLYFVADKNGDVYFSKSNSEHEEIIQKLIDEGLWYTYE